MDKQLIALLVIAAILADSGLASRIKKKGKNSSRGRGEDLDMSGENNCEDNHEFDRCVDVCEEDSDCTNESNLNCSEKCGQACYQLDQTTKCKASMLTTIIRYRADRRRNSRD